MTKFTDDKILIATHNRGKFEEIEHLLKPYGVIALFAGDMGLVVPEETENTFIGNARIKAHMAAQFAQCPALADDSGLEVHALDGAPGVYSADWAETSTGRDFVKAMTHLWNRLEKIKAPHPHCARFCCTLVLAWPDGRDSVFEGFINGVVTWPMRGTQGHGYDPIFQPDGYDITFGEMARWRKNNISHRADAFKKFIAEIF